MTGHDHPPEGDCQPSCPAWSEGVLELGALLRRHDAMLAACRAAERIEFVVVAPATSGVLLPESLKGEELVRLNLVVGRDCPEVLLDDWGIRVTLTFRGRRHECALPWPAVKAGVLTAPRKKVRRFGVVEGGASTPSQTPSQTPSPTPAPLQAPTQTPAPAPAPAPAQASTQTQTQTRTSTRTPAPAPAPSPDGEDAPSPAPPNRPRPVLGIIRGGRDDGDGDGS